MAADQPHYRQGTADPAAGVRSLLFRRILVSRLRGVPDDGKKVSAIIVQLGPRKPLLKKSVGEAAAEVPDSECPAPIWQRAPSRVTFEPRSEPKFTFTVPTRAVDLVTEEENAGEE
jgi:hypothetical protein